MNKWWRSKEKVVISEISERVCTLVIVRARIEDLGSEYLLLLRDEV